jgi:hypothetical protein
LLLRATINFKLGCFAAAEIDVESCLENYKHMNLFDVDLITCRQLKLAVLKTKASTKNKTVGKKTLEECIVIAKDSLSICQKMASSFGFMGSDANISNGKYSEVVLKNNEMTPFEYGFTDFQENNSTLTLSPAINPKKAVEVSGPRIVRSPSKRTATLAPSIDEIQKMVRGGPIDNDGTQVESEYANIYLKACRSLATCHASLCSLLQEVRNLGESEELLLEQIALGEDGLKVNTFHHKN